MNNLRPYLAFLCAGALGFVVDAGVLYLVAPQLGWHGGRLVSFLTASAATWFINRTFTFSAGPKRMPSVAQEYITYTAAMSFGMFVNLLTYAATLALFSGAWVPLVGVTLGSLAGMVFNFWSARRVLLRR